MLEDNSSKLNKLLAESLATKTDLSTLEKSALLDASREAESEFANVQIQGLKSLHDLRTQWSGVLLNLVIATTIFQATFIVLVGIGLLPFKAHEIFLNAVSGELFLQIVGMGLIVIRCLFPADAVKNSSSIASLKEKKNKKLKPTIPAS